MPVLLVVQDTALTAARLPVYALLREGRSGLALVVLTAFYLDPQLHWGNCHGFHAMLLAAPLISLAVYNIIRQRSSRIDVALRA